MTERNDQNTSRDRLGLRPADPLEPGRTVEAGSVRQSFSHGRSKVVQVEVRKKRASVGAAGTAVAGGAAPTGPAHLNPADRVLTALDACEEEEYLARIEAMPLDFVRACTRTFPNPELPKAVAEILFHRPSPAQGVINALSKLDPHDEDIAGLDLKDVHAALHQTGINYRAGIEHVRLLPLLIRKAVIVRVRHHHLAAKSPREFEAAPATPTGHPPGDQTAASEPSAEELLFRAAFVDSPRRPQRASSDEPTRTVCSASAGTGSEDKNSAAETCLDCLGARNVRIRQGLFLIDLTCPTCGGQGRVIRNFADRAAKITDFLNKGVIVTCVVTAIQSNGIEVKVGDVLTGFIRRAELARDKSDQRPDRFAVGEQVDAKVVVIDRGARKLTHTIKGNEVEVGEADNG
jgi:hypothetical protein